VDGCRDVERNLAAKPGRIKAPIAGARTHATLAVNSELIRLYCEIGHEILERPRLDRGLLAASHPAALRRGRESDWPSAQSQGRSKKFRSGIAMDGSLLSQPAHDRRLRCIADPVLDDEAVNISR
jgi:hypothetical protein